MTCNNGNEMLLVPKEKVDDCIAGMARFLQSVIEGKHHLDAASITYIHVSLSCMLQFDLINLNTYHDISGLQDRARDAQFTYEKDMAV